jgi:hypothetical protein
MRLISLLREWRSLIVVGIASPLGVGFLLGRFTASASRPRDVFLDTEAYRT